MNIGVVGTGNMGTIMVEALIDGRAISPSSMIITNRTKSKALLLKDKYKEIRVGANAEEVASQSDLLFICVKPLDIFTMLDRINPYLSPEKCIISITSPVSTSQIEKKVSCSTVRVIPSITNRALSGVSLLTYGDNCSDHWRKKVEKLISKLSVPVCIDENITRVASDIVSCGPAFFSYLLQRFIQAAVKETEIDKETATIFASEMIVGLGELLKQGHYTLPSLQEKVCVKGGITGEGIKVLDNELGDTFEHLFQATHAKFKEDLDKVEIQFSNLNSL
ncbi:late competence protein ComER [Neobacillus sp. MM2021_6]|uniref:late competence protein ComER n=1 Tax=Bacillaceae TaxID=186817 RepID=UPI0014073008|nr:MULTISPECIES: late competence protein ComER [Bacillaceae]MBO0959430.1 late competence protein ComER [Neobacillus sp. MM2021_6]NHC17272.1 late competence protein ComER [Bacillus sp. MM2020_4]